MPVIPGTREPEAEGLQVQGQPGQLGESLSQTTTTTHQHYNSSCLYLCSLLASFISSPDYPSSLKMLKIVLEKWTIS